MSIKAKIHLSNFEMELVNNREWILTKQAIINKVYLFFGEIHETYKRIYEEENKFFGQIEIAKGGKISKGENYLGLPYVILDYPATFNREDIFAIRTMFWWGNFFSITLHISGKKRMQNINTRDSFINLQHTNFFICINENEWEHNFERDNYIGINKVDEKMYAEVCSKNFFKISKKIDLKNWNEIPVFLETSFREIIKFIGVNFPTGEKVL